MKEADYENTLVAAATLLGWQVHVERTSRTKDGWATAIKGHAGWPDFFAIHPGRKQLLIVELKRKPNKPTDAQLRWLSCFRALGLACGVAWVPEDMPLLLAVLAGERFAPWELPSEPS